MKKQQGAYDPTLGFRAPVEFKQMVEDWAEQNGYSFSAACRRIITLYLQQQERERQNA